MWNVQNALFICLCSNRDRNPIYLFFLFEIVSDTLTKKLVVFILKTFVLANITHAYSLSLLLN